jgi:hypothetical protein
MCLKKIVSVVLYGCGILHLSSREELRFRESGQRILRRIF